MIKIKVETHEIIHYNANGRKVTKWTGITIPRGGDIITKILFKSDKFKIKLPPGDISDKNILPFVIPFLDSYKPANFDITTSQEFLNKNNKYNWNDCVDLKRDSSDTFKTDIYIPVVGLQYSELILIFDQKKGTFIPDEVEIIYDNIKDNIERRNIAISTHIFYDKNNNTINIYRSVLSNFFHKDMSIESIKLFLANNGNHGIFYIYKPFNMKEIHTF